MPRVARLSRRWCILARMQTTEQLSHDQVLADRARYVSGGVSTPRLVVAGADGARVTDVDGRVFVDFAGGIGCQNTGHRFAPVVEAIHHQVDQYLHQCFMVGVYEPYVDTCRLLAELSPCVGDAAEVDPRQLRRRGERERRQDRARRHRPAGGHRLRQRVPRPHAADDDHDQQGAPVQGRLRAVRARGVPRACPVPLPRRHDRRRDRGDEEALQVGGRPADRGLRAARARPGRGRLRADAAGLSRAPGRALRRARDPLRRRRGAVRRRADREDVGDRALRGRRARPARLGQVDRRRAPARGGHGSRRADGRRARGRARRHLRRQSAVVRRRDRGAGGRPRARVPRGRDAARRDAPRHGSTRSPPRGPRSATCGASGR